MKKSKGFLKTKSYGFYVTIVIAILTLVTAFVYANSYGNNARYMSWEGVYVMLAGVGLGLILTLFRQNEWVPPVLALGNFVAMMLYITKMYNYVVVVMVGIDIASFSMEFMLCSGLFAVTLAISILNIFFKQAKEAK